LVDGGMFEVAVGGDGLKHLGIDAPPTAAELLDEQGVCDIEVTIRQSGAPPSRSRTGR
jgi:hypothetical protein